MKLRDLMLDEGFRTRLVSGRGGGEFVMRYRGRSGRSHGGDDAEDGAGVARIDACLDEMEEATGLEISEACVFCSAPRTVATVQFAIPGADGGIVASYDSVRRTFALQILHPAEISIEHPSLVDLSHAHVDPMQMIGLHFPVEAEARAVRDLLARLRCIPRMPEGEEVSYETYSLELDAID